MQLHGDGAMLQFAEKLKSHWLRAGRRRRQSVDVATCAAEWERAAELWQIKPVQGCGGGSCRNGGLDVCSSSSSSSVKIAEVKVTETDLERRRVRAALRRRRAFKAAVNDVVLCNETLKK